MKKKVAITIVALFMAVVAFAALKFTVFRKHEPDISFTTARVKRGKISNTVTATGTLEAIETVDVGTQVSGVIKNIYVDFNSDVKKGQLLAEIDKRPLEAQLEQSEASLNDAKAELNFQTATYNRNKALFEKKLISQADFDQVIYNYEKAQANLMNAKSSYNRTLINLNYATITSPIDGVVLNRAVDQGQTVAASFNTPTLFTIANDLTQMKVEASVDEADIGQVKDGQRVEFTVDAYPDLTFPGKITEVRLQPVITSNVVTYTVIIDAPNPDKKLMPGMTATTTIFVDEADNDLLIPVNAASFRPDSTLMYAYNAGRKQNHKRTNKGEKNQNHHTGPGIKPNQFESGNAESENTKIVWVKKDDSIYPVTVKINITDGINYGITSGLQDGDSVILSMIRTNGSVKARQGGARSPFMPTPPRRRR